MPAMIASLALMICGGLGLWWAVWVLSGQGSLEEFSLFSSASQLSWGSALLGALSGVVLILGIVLILAAVIPGRPLLVRQAPNHGAQDHDISTAFTTRGISRIAVAEAERLDGTVSASATASQRHVRVIVNSVARDRDTVRQHIHSSIQQRLEDFGLRRQPRIMITVRKRESR
ncbi:DUF6286 domain-containing protein [Nesterenkonia muleiensis]|uniref:DUF6286 domain-containing protein n=1 Tax=Nesterenkonia muleiensis TaxID=2282648 RepID=UPI001300AC96|nr:DUF6286 domain-containing protein [Nesterenkonia muleiensis]